jgi:hypothetical protein
MPEISNGVEAPREAAGEYPSRAVNVAPAQSSTEKRLISLWGAERVKRFAVRLKANAEWVNQFLHGGPRQSDRG